MKGIYTILILVKCFVSNNNDNIDNYIITLKGGFELGLNSISSENNINELHKTLRKDKNYKLKQNFKSINGFTASMSKEQAEKISNYKMIKHIEKDQIYNLKSQQKNAPWGLARLMSRKKLGNDSKKYIYKYDKNSGKDVNVYVIDSGINIEHEEFGGRAVSHKNITEAEDVSDKIGHGTHVAGIISGKLYGVVKNADIISIKVTDEGYFFTSELIASLEAAINHAKTKGGKKGNIINLSLGGPYSFSLDLVVDRAEKEGITVVVAAGNESDNACEASPASSKSAITVGATDINDKIATYSNYGECVDIFAPGTNIISSWIGSKNQNKTISGTSMATPHITGLVAYIMSKSQKKLTKNEIVSKILKYANKGSIKDLPEETPNLLAYNYLSANMKL